MGGRRVLKLLVLVLVVGMFSGCADYLKYRAEDAMEMVDFGVTWSKKPGFAAYANGVSISPGGFASVDGYFAGVGGGQIGVTRFFEQSLGLLAWGYEEVGWGEFDPQDLKTLNRQQVGVIGYLTGPFNRRPAYPTA